MSQYPTGVLNLKAIGTLVQSTRGSSSQNLSIVGKKKGTVKKAIKNLT